MFIEKHEIQVFLIIASLSILLALGFSIVLMVVYSRNLRQRQKESFKLVLEEVEKERKRIGQNLHDDIGPFLASTRLRLNAAVRKLPEHDPLKIIINEQALNIQNSVATIREVSHKLVPTHLLKDGLIASIEERCQEISALPHWQANVEASTFPDAIALSYQLNMYRILNELFHNSLKHSDGSEIYVNLSEYDDFLEINYTDNGKGLQHKSNLKSGIGLSGIITRAELMKGKVEFHISSNGFKATLKFKVAQLYE